MRIALRNAAMAFVGFPVAYQLDAPVILDDGLVQEPDCLPA